MERVFGTMGFVEEREREPEGGDLDAEIARHAPAGIDAEIADLARSATVTQLRRGLGSYSFADDKASDKPGPGEPVPPAPPEETWSPEAGR